MKITLCSKVIVDITEKIDGEYKTRYNESPDVGTIEISNSELEEILGKHFREKMFSSSQCVAVKCTIEDEE